MTANKWTRPSSKMVQTTVLVLAVVFVLQLQHSTWARVQEATDPKSGDDAELEMGATNSCHWREFDLCAVGVASLFQNGNGLPQTSAELKRQCEMLSESVRCFEQYSNKCLTERQAQLMQMFAGPSLQVWRDFCRADSELRANYTQHAPCYRQVQRQVQRRCVSDLQSGFEWVHRLNTSARLATACCNLNRFKECVFEPIEYECGLAAEQTIGQLMETMLSSLAGITCREYNPYSDNCLQLLPKNGTKPQGARGSSALSKLVSGFVNVPSRL